MAKYIVATIDELPPGTRKIVEIAGQSVGVFNVAGEYFALRNRCPHRGGPLCEGRLAGFVESNGPGDLRYSRRGEILRCPWHAWEYDIRTGQSYFSPSTVRARPYDVTIERGANLGEMDAETAPTVTVIAGTGTRTSGASGIQLGPYVAQTFPVTVDQQYVLVELDG